MNGYKYSLTELENMLPWEREVYIKLLIEDIKKKQEQRRNNGR